MFIARYQAHPNAVLFVGIANDEREAEAMLVARHNFNYNEEPGDAVEEFSEVEEALEEMGGSAGYQPIGSEMMALEF
jgi:hypothetical protein